jgi:hypothetical protein
MNHVFFSNDPSLNLIVKPFIENLKLCNLNIITNDQSDNVLKTKTLIDTSAIFICLVTKEYSKNDNCMFEVDYAFQTQKHIIFLMYENVSTKDLDHLGYLIAGQKVHNVYEDREKLFLNGEGFYFEQIFNRLKEIFKIEFDVAEKDMNKPFKYDLFISYENDQQERVKKFTETLKDKNLKIYYNDSVFLSKTSPASYKKLQDSASVLAIVTKKFLGYRSCTDETSYAIRNKIPINILMDKDVDLKDGKNELTQILTQNVPAKDIINDLTILDKPINDNSEIFSKIDGKIKIGLRSLQMGVFNLFNGKIDRIQM